jgi:hypothetical protein
MNCCVSERDIITKLAQRIGLSRWNHDVEYNSSLKISNGQSEAANRRIDNTEHLISRPVFVGFLLFNLLIFFYSASLLTQHHGSAKMLYVTDNTITKETEPTTKYNDL